MTCHFYGTSNGRISDIPTYNFPAKRVRYWPKEVIAQNGRILALLAVS